MLGTFHMLFLLDTYKLDWCCFHWANEEAKTHRVKTFVQRKNQGLSTVSFILRPLSFYQCHQFSEAGDPTQISCHLEFY